MHLTNRTKKEMIPRSPNMEEALKLIEEDLPFKELEGIRSQLTMEDTVEDYISMKKSIFPFFYFLGFFSFLFLCLMLISLYQIKWTYHINQFIYNYWISMNIEIKKKNFFVNTILDLVRFLIH